MIFTHNNPYLWVQTTKYEEMTYAYMITQLINMLYFFCPMVIFGLMGLVYWLKYSILCFVFNRSSSFCLLTLSHSVECLCNPSHIYVNIFLCTNLFFNFGDFLQGCSLCGHLNPIFPQYFDYNENKERGEHSRGSRAL